MLAVFDDTVVIPSPIKISEVVVAVDYEGRYLLSEDGEKIITEDNKTINLYRNGR